MTTSREAALLRRRLPGSVRLKFLLVGAQKFRASMEADKLRFARAHLRRSEQTSYALTRKYAWLPTIESDEHKTKYVDTFVEDA